ncbi:MAG: hypothetical protein JSU91_05925 [Thermoplasmatales archaeon]|nr:MAG: hypothetical protein JSU91_05925 [Thermoplasmatales archaeon]
MEDIRIILAGIWIALMLIYLLGDVMRIFAGDFKPGEIEGTKMTQGMLMLMALLMLIPIIMVVLSLTLSHPTIRWLHIVAAGFLFVFNIAGVRSYPGIYDRFLIIVGLVFNVITIWYAWNWI